MQKAIFLVALFYSSLLNAQKQTFELPRIDYDKVEENEGTKTFTRDGRLVLEIHYPFNNSIKHYCYKSNAVYDSIYIIHGKNMSEIRFNNSQYSPGIFSTSWKEGSNILLIEQFYPDKSLKERFRAIAKNAVYNQQSPACAYEFLKTGIYESYDEEGNETAYVDFDSDKARFKTDNSSKKGKLKLLELKKAADEVVINAYGKAFFEHHIKLNRQKSRGYYPTSFVYPGNNGQPSQRFAPFYWYMPENDTITFADFSYNIFLDEDHYSDIIVVRLDPRGNVVSAKDNSLANPENMTRGLITGTHGQRYLSPGKAIEYAGQNGLKTGENGYLIDVSWVPFDKGGTNGRLYYRILFNRFEKPMAGGNLFLYDEWLIDPFNREIIKDREFKDGVFSDMGYSRRTKRDGKYGFKREFFSDEIRIPFEYDELPYDLGYLMIAKKNGLYGLITMNNEVNIPFEYDQLNFVPFDKTRFRDDFLTAKKGSFFGLLDKDGNEILPFEYSVFQKTEENIITGFIGGMEKVSYHFRTREIVHK